MYHLLFYLTQKYYNYEWNFLWGIYVSVSFANYSKIGIDIYFFKTICFILGLMQ